MGIFINARKYIRSHAEVDLILVYDWNTEAHRAEENTTGEAFKGWMQNHEG